ncbi:MAG: OmpA family protein [Phycisphaerae bacterium]|nr:OmpA family protein [Phycisphaerae bacterium]
MNRGRMLLLSGVVAVLVLMASGCEDKKLKEQNQDLMNANAKLQGDIARLNDEKAALEREKADLLAQLRAKDAALAMKVPQIPPLPVAPPTPAVTVVKPDDDDGFKGMDVERNANTVTVNLSGDVLFDSGKATLRAAALATLDKIASVIKTKHAGHKIRVIGHTDSDPIKKSGWKDNWELSSARAQAVGNYLAKQGVTNKMEVVGVANTEPRVPEKTKDDKAKNRRVGVQVVLK